LFIKFIGWTTEVRQEVKGEGLIGLLVDLLNGLLGLIGWRIMTQPQELTPGQAGVGLTSLN
jgi:hypothetical protein